MAFQSVPSCAVGSIQGTLNGANWANVLNFTAVGGSYSQSDIDDLAVALDAWYSTEILPLVSSALTYTQVVVRGLELENDLISINNDNTGAGAGATTPLPNNVAFCCKFGTGLTGRSARGRIYFCGLGVGALQANERFISSSSADALIDALEALATYLVGTVWVHVVVSRVTGGSERPTGIFFPIIQYSYSDLRLDTMRRRMGSST